MAIVTKPKKRKTPRLDVNQLARQIIERAIDDKDEQSEPADEAVNADNAN